jgi:hypothetical protein
MMNDVVKNFCIRSCMSSSYRIRVRGGQKHAESGRKVVHGDRVNGGRWCRKNDGGPATVTGLKLALL